MKDMQQQYIWQQKITRWTANCCPVQPMIGTVRMFDASIRLNPFKG